jgi:hypothetical protein
LVYTTLNNYHNGVYLSLKALLSSLPVDNLPDSLEVLNLTVLVLKVVGVLPSVDSDDGLVLSDDGVLVL